MIDLRDICRLTEPRSVYGQQIAMVLDAVTRNPALLPQAMSAVGVVQMAARAGLWAECREPLANRRRVEGDRYEK